MDLKHSITPGNNCSYLIVDNIVGLTGGNKSHSSLHDVKLTYMDENKAAVRKGEDSSFVIKVNQDTQVSGIRVFVNNSYLVHAPSENTVKASINSSQNFVTNYKNLSKMQIMILPKQV